MAILTSDAEFKKRTKKSAKVDRDGLWRELHEIASFFALTGALDDALKIWKFLYSGLVPLPDADDRTVSVFGDGAISAVCFQLKLPDISKGQPPPSFAGREKRNIITGDLTKRVVALDQVSRQRITGDAWSDAEWVNDPRPDLVATSLLRRARILAIPLANGKPSATDSEALSILTDLIDDNPGFRALHPCYQAEGQLLAADIAARHDRLADAERFLQMWRDCSITWDYSVGEAFGLIPIAGLICNGCLSAKHNLSPTDREEISRQLLEDLSARLSKPEPPKPPKWKYKIYVSYSQFYLEPMIADPQAVYFQKNGESEQGFSSFPCQVAFGLPGEADECVVEVKFATKMPVAKTAMQVVAVPLTVEEPGGLYLRTVDDGGKKCHLEIPLGGYDVVAALYSQELKKKTTCSNSWRVVLTFLPSGTVTPGCLKTSSGIPPESVILNK